ncbi:MAG: FAD-dependent oxidoreductase, partial [Planctomycetota bacterium]
MRAQPPRTFRRETRVCVLGGGIVGVSLARELARRGRTVTLLEREEVGAGASTAAVGVLRTPAPNKLSAYSRLTRAGYFYHRTLAQELLEETGIDVGYLECGALKLYSERPTGQKADRAL